MWIDDPLQEVREQASEVKRTAKVDRFLIDDESPLVNPKDLRLIADRFDINIDNNKPEVAAFNIRTAILDGEKNNNPDVNIDSFLNFAETLYKKRKKPKKEKEEASEEAEIESKVYTIEELNDMTQQELNAIADSHGIAKPPRNTRINMTAEILEKQTEVVTDL